MKMKIKVMEKIKSISVKSFVLFILIGFILGAVYPSKSYALTGDLPQANIPWCEWVGEWTVIPGNPPICVGTGGIPWSGGTWETMVYCKAVVSSNGTLTCPRCKDCAAAGASSNTTFDLPPSIFCTETQTSSGQGEY